MPDPNLLENVIKCTKKESDALVKPILPDELWNTLKTCKDSSPGPDGIPYSVYKAFWPVLGKSLTDSYNYSIEMGSFSLSQKESYLRLIPKEGKD